MWLIILIMSYLLAQHCSGIHLIDLPNPEQEDTTSKQSHRRNFYYKPKSQTSETSGVRDWLFRQSEIIKHPPEDEKDADIKFKISTLVQQTIHDTERKVKSIAHLKESYRDQPPYRMGFILNMIKKSRDVLNELFNVAIKHRDQWMALEQLKIFELIVHTNVDTTNLVRQLVEIHIQFLNSTSDTGTGLRKRVVLL